MILWFIVISSFLIWINLIFFRGMFWLIQEREQHNISHNAIVSWPAVVAIIPSRNEADTLPISLPSLAEQDYPGLFSIIVVDDASEDATYEIAKNISEKSKRNISVVRGSNIPSAEWTGKMWALHQGIVFCKEQKFPYRYFLLTDADIFYEKQSVRDIVLKAQEKGTLLTSLMVKLQCNSFSEKLLIPAFVYFFNMIYPFSWVNRLDKKTAAAAGGCMLLDQKALESIGGISSIKSALIDDCALAKKVKKLGPIWLGFGETVISLRKYSNLNDIRKMVSRTAFDQLNNSYFQLFGTVCGLGVLFLSPLCLSVFAMYPKNLMALIVWCGMTMSFIPTLRYYKKSALWSLFFPVIVLCYLLFTLDSAFQNFQGKGGLWKGRVQAVKKSA